MRRIVCKGYAGYWGGIFYTQAARRGYLKLLAFFLIWQKKTAVSLKVPIVVRVQNVKVVQVWDHPRGYGVTHKTEPLRYTSYLNIIYCFKRG